MSTPHHAAALAMWAGMSHDDRKEILSALGADLATAADDYAALPPQVRAGIVAGMPSPAPEAATDTHDDSDGTDDDKPSRRKR